MTIQETKIKALETALELARLAPPATLEYGGKWLVDTATVIEAYLNQEKGNK